MKNNMRWLAVLLALVTVLAMFAACRRGTPDKNPVETDPVVTESAETNPAETKPAETKPAETEPAATEPAATEPAETEPAETEPAETEPTETKPVETESTETEPEETKPAVTPSVGGGSIHWHSYSETVVKATCVNKGYTLTVLTSSAMISKRFRFSLVLTKTVKTPSTPTKKPGLRAL